MLRKSNTNYKSSSLSSFPHLSCFSHQTRIFLPQKPCFVPQNLTHPTFTAKRYLYYTVKFAKTKGLFRNGNYH